MVVWSNSGALIKAINDHIKSELVDSNKFFADMSKLYLSKYLIEVLRNYYTEKERKKLNKNKKNTRIGLMECESDWPICLENIVMNNYYHKSPSFYLYRSSSILGNFKPEHFPKKRKQIKKDIVDRASVRNAHGVEMHTDASNLFDSEVPEADIKVSEKQLLIERTKHICKYGCNPAVEKREHERKKKQMLFKVDVASKKKGHKRDNSSAAKFSSQKLNEVDHMHFYTPEEKMHKDREKRTKDDISLASPVREPSSNKLEFRSKLDLTVELHKPLEPKPEVLNLQDLTKEEAIAKLKKPEKTEDPLSNSSLSHSQTQIQTRPRKISDSKPSLLSRMNPMNFFKKKPAREQSKPAEVIVAGGNESREMSDEEVVGRRKANEQTIEIESDEEDDALFPDRDIVRRITLLKAQFDKIGVEDDLEFGEMFKSLVIRNVNKFDLPEQYE